MSVGTMTSAPLLEKESQFAGLHHDVSRASERPVTSVSRGVGVSRPHVWDREHQYMQTNETAAATQSIMKPMAKAAEIVRRETWESCNPFLASPVHLRTANTSSLKNTVNQTVCSILPVMNSCSKKSSVNLFSASEWHDHLPVKAAEKKEIQRLESCTSYETKTQQRRSASAVSCLTQQSLGATVSIVQLEKESGFQSTDWNECRGAMRNVFHMSRATECTCPTICEKEDALSAVQTLTLNKAVAAIVITHELVAVVSASSYQLQSPAVTCSLPAFCLNHQSVVSSVSMVQLEKESYFSFIIPQLKHVSVTRILNVRKVARIVVLIVLSREAEYSAETHRRYARISVTSSSLKHASLKQTVVLNAARLFFADFGAVQAKTRQVQYNKKALVVSRTPELVSCSYAVISARKPTPSVASIREKSPVQEPAKYQVRCQVHAIVSSDDSLPHSLTLFPLSRP